MVGNAQNINFGSLKYQNNVVSGRGGSKHESVFWYNAPASSSHFF